MTRGTTVGRAVLALGLMLSLGLIGCGGDDDDDAGSGGGGASGASGMSGGGSGGSSGAMSGAGTGGGGGMMMMRMPVMCNGMPCMPPGMSLLMPCCLPDQSCGGGLMGECQPWNAPGMADSRCPAHMTQTGSMLPGCCKADNKCGVMSGQGLGCIERTEVARYAGGPLTARACDAPPDADAGSP